MGARDSDEVVAALATTDVFALTPTVTDDGDRDGIPNVLVEAMACALPVVTTAVGGIPELVENGVNGALVAPDDPAGVADALQQLLDDPSLRSRLGAAARVGVEDAYDVDKAARRLRDVFRSPQPVPSWRLRHADRRAGLRRPSGSRRHSGPGSWGRGWPRHRAVCRERAMSSTPSSSRESARCSSTSTPGDCSAATWCPTAAGPVPIRPGGRARSARLALPARPGPAVPAERHGPRLPGPRLARALSEAGAGPMARAPRSRMRLLRYRPGSA